MEIASSLVLSSILPALVLNGKYTCFFSLREIDALPVDKTNFFLKPKLWNREMANKLENWKWINLIPSTKRINEVESLTYTKWQNMALFDELVNMIHVFFLLIILLNLKSSMSIIGRKSKLKQRRNTHFVNDIINSENYTKMASCYFGKPTSK